MDVKRELQALVESGLKFSIELTGHGVLIWVGDYVRQSAAAASVATLENALEWLRENAAAVPSTLPGKPAAVNVTPSLSLVYAVANS